MSTYELKSSIIQLSTDLPLFDKHIFLPSNKKKTEKYAQKYFDLWDGKNVTKLKKKCNSWLHQIWAKSVAEPFATIIFIFFFWNNENHKSVLVNASKVFRFMNISCSNLNRPYAHCSSLNQIFKADILPNLLSHVKRISHSSILICQSFVVNMANFFRSMYQWAHRARQLHVFFLTNHIKCDFQLAASLSNPSPLNSW